MFVRCELFDWHNVYLMEVEGKKAYAYSIPYYHVDECDVMTDHALLFSITPEVYSDLMLAKTGGIQSCQEYVTEHYDRFLMNHEEVEGVEYLANTRNYIGPIMSKVFQIMLFNENIC